MNPPDDTPSSPDATSGSIVGLDEERFSLKIMLEEVLEEHRTGSFGTEHLEQDAINRLFETQKEILRHGN